MIDEQKGKVPMVAKNTKKVSKKGTKKKTGKKRTAKKKTTTKSSSGKGQIWTFPKNSLEDAIRIARAIEDKNAGTPMRTGDLAKALGYNQPADWRFRDLLRSANQYELVSGSGTTATIRLEAIGEDIVAPSSSTQRQTALLLAFRSVGEFRAVEEFFGGNRLPEDEFFENTLVRDFAIPRNRVETYIEIFTKNLRYLKLFAAADDSTTKAGEVSASSPTPASSKTSPRPVATERVREFLDTCFVMMPFGEWFDRYYQEIYVPSIKDAGFEPLRADELFSTGTVVEQIWEQVNKASVLLADLTDKNANVFYELGLAHAACKPVVFTASKIDDVPFDLRHLRVIVYDIREPDWGAKLGEAVTEFLKNAKAEPHKSIPQPFREEHGNSG